MDIGERYEATDPDPSDILTYSVSGTDAALFQVDANGQLQVKEALDYEDGGHPHCCHSGNRQQGRFRTTEQTPLPDDATQ